MVKETQKRLVVYSDYVCPWCYFGLPALQVLLEKYDIAIERRAFQILPAVPPEGITVAEYDAQRGVDAAERALRNQKISEVTKEVGLPWIPRTHFFQTMPAHILGKWCNTQEIASEVYPRAVFQAVYEYGKNIFQTEVLLEIIDKVGLSRSEAQEALKSPKFREEVEADLKSSRSLAITGVPTYLFGQVLKNGHQPLEVLEALIQEA